jgi:predicted RNase H-related nuclease YkuK (DUF458 family)
VQKFDLEKVKQFISDSSQESKIYIGADSERFKLNGVWHADYCVAVIIHKDGKHGCKVFGDIARQKDFDAKPGRPALRLMNEVYMVHEMYEKLAEVIGERYVELHLDINPSERHGSSCVVNQAIGYIRGACNIIPQVKPQAFAASICADRLKGLLEAA